jgi:N-acetylglucosamine-6-phosphate deacetylase
METIRFAVDNGIVVELGHTGADYDTAIAAIDAGATVSTHTFNGMIGLNHRSPGVLGAVLTDDRVHCEVMGDFGHVAPAIVKLIYRAKGDDRVNFVSDSTAMAGYPDGRYEVEGGVNIIENGLSRLENGTINGSAATVLLGVQNARKIDIPLESAVKMASYNPAVSLGIDNECGSIAVGKRADLFVADENIRPLATYVGGQKVFSV